MQTRKRRTARLRDGVQHGLHGVIVMCAVAQLLVNCDQISVRRALAAAVALAAVRRGAAACPAIRAIRQRAIRRATLVRAVRTIVDVVAIVDRVLDQEAWFDHGAFCVVVPSHDLNKRRAVLLRLTDGGGEQGSVRIVVQEGLGGGVACLEAPPHAADHGPRACWRVAVVAAQAVGVRPVDPKVVGINAGQLWSQRRLTMNTLPKSARNWATLGALSPSKSNIGNNGLPSKCT